MFFVPTVRRMVALVCAALCFILFALFFLWLLSIGAFIEDPTLACIILFGLALPMAFSLFAGNPPPSWRARIEVSKDRLRFIPDLVMRWIGEPSVEVTLAPQSKEILICRGRQENPVFGIRLILCLANGHRQEVNISTPFRLYARHAGILAQGITATTGLPTRFVQLQRLANSGIQEIPWQPPAHPQRAFAIVCLILAATPFAAGTLVGCLHLDLLPAFGIGTALWIGGILALFAWSRRSSKQSKFGVLYALCTVVTFSAEYAAAIVIAASCFR